MSTLPQILRAYLTPYGIVSKENQLMMNYAALTDDQLRELSEGPYNDNEVENGYLGHLLTRRERESDVLKP